MKEYNLSCLADYMLVRSSSSSFPDDILHSGQQTSSLLAPPFPFWLIWWFAITLLSQPIFIHSLSKLLRHLGPWPPQLQLQRFGLSAGSQAFQFIVTTLLGLPHILAIWSDSSADGEQFTALRFLPLSIEQPYSWTWCLLWLIHCHNSITALLWFRSICTSLPHSRCQFRNLPRDV